MATLDWLVIVLYLCALLLLAWHLGKQQHDNNSYYLGSGQIPPWALATSVIATQCSTNSLLGAPAFVGFTQGGGMLWLQYEMAVPLAMLALGFLFVQIKKHNNISIYAFLEERLGRNCRLVASSSFLFFRAIATGVTIYGVASVLRLITGLGYLESVVALMTLTILYDVFGGIKAVVYSDVLQMALLLTAIIVGLIFLWDDITLQANFLKERSQVITYDWGLSGTNYGLWPMLFGGLFLYMAYYGCDQSQAQRILAAKDEKAAIKVLWFNGLFRFPLVFLYCLLGIGLGAYSLNHPNFLTSLPPTQTGTPNINLVFPYYVIETFPVGLVGLIIVGIFAAAMSSIDSALNSLSASTMQDFIQKSKSYNAKRELYFAKGTTLLWGVFAVIFSFQVESIAPTVLESINKIGSIVNGPLLSLFLLAAFARNLSGRVAIFGFATGFLINLYLWLFLPEISWLWWNVTGCLVSLLSVVIISGGRLVFSNLNALGLRQAWRPSLLVYFVLIFLLCALFPLIL